MDQQQRQQQLRKAFQAKIDEFRRNRTGYLELVTGSFTRIREMINAIESSLLRDIRTNYDSFYAITISELDGNEPLTEPDLRRLEKIARQPLPLFEGPTKEDFLEVEKAIHKLRDKPHPKPQRIEGRATGVGTVTLKWDKLPGKAKYCIEMRKPSEGVFHKVYEGLSTEFTVTGLEVGAAYLFRVNALYGNGTVGEWSEVIEVATPEIPVPQWFTATPLSETSVRLSWAKAIEIDDGEANVMYCATVKQNSKEDSCEKVIYNGQETEFTVYGLRPSTEYVFSLCVKCENNRSKEMKSVWCKTKNVPAPSKVTAKFVLWDVVNLSWEPAVTSINKGDVSYIVEMQQEYGTKGEDCFKEVYSGPETSWEQNICLEQSTGYIFRVCTVAFGKERSEWSEVRKMTPALTAPTDLAAEVLSWDTIKVKWGRIEGASFKIKIEENAKTKYRTRTIECSGTETLLKALVPDTEYRVSVQAGVHGSWSECWSDTATLKTQKAPDFSQCAWKESLLNFMGAKKYIISGSNRRMLTCNDDVFGSTAIGDSPFPLGKVTSWSVKFEKPFHGLCDSVGVAPSDIDLLYYKNQITCGWYYEPMPSVLCSGPPHNYIMKPYGPCILVGEKKPDKVIMPKVVSVVVDTTKGEISFALEGKDLGVAYEGVPLDKPLVPCLCQRFVGDVVELVI